MKNYILLIIVFSFCLGAMVNLPAQELSDSLAKQNVDLGGTDFLQYYDDVYTEGFVWLIEDKMYVGKEEWTDGFYAYALYIDPTEKGILVDSTVDKAGNQLRIMKVDRENRPSYYILRAWKAFGEEKKIELEILMTEAAFEKKGLKAVKKMRKRWERFSNLKQPEALLYQVYAEDAWYVNGGKVIQGQSTIAKRYSYMKQSNWSISLNALGLVQVDEATVLEIGEYYSNGPGNYVLLWKKDPEKGWLVQLDFNF